jgi:dTDP-4-amino-4,6-dideoxygalactose transaminase
LAGHDIETRPVWKPMHLQPVFAGTRAALTGVAQRLFETGLTLPSGSVMAEPDTSRVLDAIDEFLAAHR